MKKLALVATVVCILVTSGFTQDLLCPVAKTRNFWSFVTGMCEKDGFLYTVHDRAGIIKWRMHGDSLEYMDHDCVSTNMIIDKVFVTDDRVYMMTAGNYRIYYYNLVDGDFSEQNEFAGYGYYDGFSYYKNHFFNGEAVFASLVNNMSRLWFFNTYDNLSLVTTYDIYDTVRNIVKQDDCYYVLTNTNILVMERTGNNVSIVQNIVHNGSIDKLFISENSIYSCSNNVIYKYNIGDNGILLYVDYFDVETEIDQCSIEDDNLIVVDANGVTWYDVSDFSDPELVAELDYDFGTTDYMEVCGGNIVVEGAFYLHYFRIQNHTIEFLDTYRNMGQIENMILYDGTIAVYELCSDNILLYDANSMSIVQEIDNENELVNYDYNYNMLALLDEEGTLKLYVYDGENYCQTDTLCTPLILPLDFNESWIKIYNETKIGIMANGYGYYEVNIEDVNNIYVETVEESRYFQDKISYSEDGEEKYELLYPDSVIVYQREDQDHVRVSGIQLPDTSNFMMVEDGHLLVTSVYPPQILGASLKIVNIDQIDAPYLEYEFAEQHGHGVTLAMCGNRVALSDLNCSFVVEGNDARPYTALLMYEMMGDTVLPTHYLVQKYQSHVCCLDSMFIYTTNSYDIRKWTFQEQGVEEPHSERVPNHAVDLYPNPFNATVNIQVQLNKPELVDIKVYNLMGQEIDTLYHGKLSAGIHAYSFDASLYASGVYFCRIKSGEHTEFKKMVLLR